MTSLTEVYDGNAGEVSSLRRLYAGTGLVLIGAVLAVLAVLVATTGLFSAVGGGDFGAVRIAGVLAGLGVPAALVGVFIVLPTGRPIKAAAAISASLCVLGVALFAHAYPNHWRGHGDDLTLLVSAVYLLGLFTAVWCLFTAVVNFKTRNDPGGMLEMNVTRKGQTKVVEVEGSSGGFGGIGFLGTTPDGEVETQTNDAEPSTPVSNDDRGGDPTRRPRKRPATPTAGVGTGPAASDGGAAAKDISSPLDDDHGAEIVDSRPQPAEPTDRYCGNCTHFEYRRSDAGMTPYCGRHDESMDDMDACEEWTPNRQ